MRISVATLLALRSEGLARLAKRERDQHGIGCAHNEDQIREMPAIQTPHVILPDHGVLRPNSKVIIARVRQAAFRVRTPVFATTPKDGTTLAVLRAGASELVGRQSGYRVLLALFWAVVAGELWAHRRIAAQAIDQLVSLAPQKQEPPAPATMQPIDQLASPVARKRERPSQLTKREWEVVEGVGKGMRNREIARSRGISERTVKSHLNNIFSKAHVKSRLALTL